MKKILFTLLLALTASLVYAIPAKPGLTKVLTLSDGTTVQARLVGDEFAHYWLGTDGKAYQTVDGTTTYRAVNRQTVTQRAQARRSQSNTRRMKRMAPQRVGEIKPISGDKKGLIILVNFTDVSFKSANANTLFQRIANEQNFSEGNFKGSVFDYFLAQSEGDFRLMFDVIGPVRVSKSQQYYGENNSNGDDMHPAEMVIEALKLADSQVNYADYDWDGDKEVDQVYVIYAGDGEADGGADNTIWPHEWTLNSAKEYHDGTGSLKLDGVTIDTYACGGELNHGTGEEAGVGTICHEFSHCIGLPDFYDTSGGGAQGMDSWDLMDGGSYNGDGYQPSGYTSYERWVLGWKTPKELTSTQTVSNMKALQEEGSDIYIIYNPGNKNEYFLLENRQKIGWDESLYGSGLLILHVDYDQDAWDNNTPNNNASHQRMTWIPADNEYQWDTYHGSKYYTAEGLAQDPYPYGSNNAFNKYSTPAAKLYNKNTDGTYFLNTSVEGITQNNDKTITFVFEAQDYKPYYKAANGKKGEALKTALCGIIYNRSEQTYNSLWTAYKTTDVRSDGKIWDMYSNITNYTPTTSSSNYSKEGDCYNREHSFPASWFGDAKPMYTDLYHVYPTDGYVNNRRGNYPFGETNGEKYKSAGDFSKLGSCTYAGYDGTVFEPADEYKGDFARTYFYMVTCYEEKLADWYNKNSDSRTTLDGKTYPGLQPWQLSMLLKWAANDPVSEKEIQRNEAVYAIQKNRNPFIDYPGLEQYIWGTMTDEAFDYTSGNLPVNPTPVDPTPVNPTAVGNGYVLVTDASTLAAGDKILITYINDGKNISKVLSTTQNTNNRSAVNITRNSDGSLTPGDDAQIITLEKSGDHFLFNVGNGYLYAASSGNNYLRTEATADENAEATIEITSGNAAIIFQGSNTRNILRYNPNNNSPMFSCYGSNTSIKDEPQIYRLASAVSLADASSENSITIANYDGTKCSVKLSDRSLFKDGNWNTLCLPFDVTIADSPLAGATAKTLTAASMNGNQVSLTFGESVTKLEAGVPYIIKWDTNDDPVEEPTFTGVTLVAKDEAERTVSLADGHVKFIGYFDAFDITPADDDIFYLTADNTLKHTAVVRTLSSCRAYFQFSPTDGQNNVRDFIFNIDFDGATTGLDTLNAQPSSLNMIWFTLDGRRLDKQPTQRGIYIQNGQKFVIK